MVGEDWDGLYARRTRTSAYAGSGRGAPGRTGEIDRAGEASPNSSCILVE